MTTTQATNPQAPPSAAELQTALFALIDTIGEELELAVEGEHKRLRRQLIEAVEDFYVGLDCGSFASDESWWPLLRAAENLASRIEEASRDAAGAHDVGLDRLFGAGVLGDSWAQVEAGRQQIEHPRPTRKVVELESLADLDRGGVSDQQIAKIYRWYNEEGFPDVERVKAARRGDVEAPRAVVHNVAPPKLRRPESSRRQQLANRIARTLSLAADEKRVLPQI